MGAAGRLPLAHLLTTGATTGQTWWPPVKADPGKPTLTPLRPWVARRPWRTPSNHGASALAMGPSINVHHLATDAHHLEAPRMQRMPPAKRYTYAAARVVLRTHRPTQRAWLDLSTTPLARSWVADTWWRLVTGTTMRTRTPPRVNRRHFEVCVCSPVRPERQSGDLWIPGSAQVADSRAQLISWAD